MGCLCVFCDYGYLDPAQILAAIQVGRCEMKYKSNMVDGRNVSFSSDWINDLEERIHFEWYHQQADLVYKNCTREQNILEVGIGTGLLSDLLKKRGWNLVTLDIDEDKRPDFCCSALDFEYGAHAIDVVLAFEIFEHIPFETFKKIVCKLADQNVKNIYFSLPWSERNAFELYLKVPKLKGFRFYFDIPRNVITEKSHFWELSIKEKVLKDEKHLIRKETLENVFATNGYKMASVNKLGNIEYFSASVINQ